MFDNNTFFINCVQNQTSVYLFIHFSLLDNSLSVFNFNVEPISRSRRRQRVGGDARRSAGPAADAEGRAGGQRGLTGRTDANAGNTGLRSFQGRGRGLHKVEKKHNLENNGTIAVIIN